MIPENMIDNDVMSHDTRMYVMNSNDSFANLTQSKSSLKEGLQQPQSWLTFFTSVIWNDLLVLAGNTIAEPNYQSNRSPKIFRDSPKKSAAFIFSLVNQHWAENKENAYLPRLDLRRIRSFRPVNLDGGQNRQGKKKKKRFVQVVPTMVRFHVQLTVQSSGSFCHANATLDSLLDTLLH
ncbi:hypothetical protein CEXT_441501 [Caerostris extrusa]|uniref:Uncharacterized protein n=1 Tax=Caerostris extrusa TaxID=172846 RepID=A0AAV4XL48_CAEEX|nr:hypothetical protein CEXT_441501 [Caerostris extrusa]